MMTILKLASDSVASAFFIPPVVSGSAAATLFSAWLHRAAQTSRMPT
jgi:hypothetical protein